MADLSATIRLRPTRIALLVRPTDLASIRTFMRLSVCLWGGVYNPIVPVFRTPPKDWRPDLPERLKGAAIARGYVEFFEPDVYLEAEPGLLDEIGLGTLRDKHGVHKRVLALTDMLKQQSHRDWAELAVGLGIVDAIRHLYDTEQRFELRDKRPACLVKPRRGDAMVEAVFGVYPTDKPSSYIANMYRDAFKPEALGATPQTWLKVFEEHSRTPLHLTRYKLDTNRSWHHEPVFYLFDPAKSTDLIDLWNMRIEPAPLLPIPISWWPDLAGDVEKAIVLHHRPLQGNPHGVMHHSTIEFARSIGEKEGKDALARLSADIPKGAWSYKTWRNRIWVRHKDEPVHRDPPIRLTTQEKRVNLTVQGDTPPTASFEALAPDFASPYGGGHDARWVNVVNLGGYRRHDIATVLPWNVLDPTWPRLDYLGDRVTVGSEGWAFAQRYKETTETIQLLTQEDAVIGSLKRLGVEARLSEAGHIARQVLQHLGGMWGVHLLADPPTLQLLNTMAGGVRRRGEGENESEEVFERRARPARTWDELIAQRRTRRRLPEVTVGHFTDCNVIRLGLTTRCPHCTASNWHSLTAVDYEIACERCLKTYLFPQAALMKENGNWCYRVIGPFSTPDYARGSYGALLALNVLDRCNSSHEAMTFAPALDCSFNGVACEADYVAWVGHQSMGKELHPDLVIGEAKSFGKGDLIKPRDLAKLRHMAEKLPSAMIVISVMRESLTDGERRILLPFVKWARRLDGDGEPTNPVVLLTGVELFHNYDIGSTWKDRGGRHADFADYEHTRNLKNFAQATQAIYLDLPLFYEDQRAVWEKTRARRKNRRDRG